MRPLPGRKSTPSLTTWLLTLVAVQASPVSIPSPDSPANSDLIKRTPVSAKAFADGDWPTNVVMVGGSETYGMWVPQDGQWHDTSSIMCLDVPAYNIVNCAAVQVDNIGVATGYGPCTFIGSSGWSASVSGNSGSGYRTVGPPQAIVWAYCAA